LVLFFAFVFVFVFVFCLFAFVLVVGFLFIFVFALRSLAFRIFGILESPLLVLNHCGLRGRMKQVGEVNTPISTATHQYILEFDRG